MTGARLVETITTALVTGGLFTAAAALWQAHNSRRAGIKGDEREARRDQATQRRDTVADRDSQIDQLQEDVTGLRTEVARLTSLVRTQSLDLEIEREYSRVLIDHIYRGAPPPPPPRPVRTA